jgi:acyl carrier protein
MSTAQGDIATSQIPASAADPASVTRIVAELQKMIAHDLDTRIEEHAIDPGVPLLEGGLMLDSMVLFELITLIEKRYGVAFSTDNLRSDVFATLEVLAQNIVTMIQNEQSGRAAQ